MDSLFQTTLKINLGAIKNNVAAVCKNYNGYKYRIAVVKGNCYGFGWEKIVASVIEAGCNYLAAGTLSEALLIRKTYKKDPIMLLTVSDCVNYEKCVENNISVSVATIKQAKAAAEYEGLKVHIRANGGRDIYNGPKTKEEFNRMFEILHKSYAENEGIYLHNYNPLNKSLTEEEYTLFNHITADINLTESFKIISLSNSLTLPRYEKKTFENAFRIGNLIYGIENTSSDYIKCFVLTSFVSQIYVLYKGESVGYFNGYTAKKESEYVAVLPVGYADGFLKANVGSSVYINNHKFRILQISMNASLSEADEYVKLGDTAELIKDNMHLSENAEHLMCNPEEIICTLNERVKRVYL